MTECFNTEFKEQLPELVADALEPVARARVEQHVADCGACAEELEILRIVRDAVIPVPYINVPKIVGSLPPAPVPVRDELPWYRRASLQMAAAVLLVAGGLVSVRQAGDRVEASSRQVALSQAPVADQATGEVAPSVASEVAAAPRAVANDVAQPASKTDIALVSGLDEMTTQELSTLLDDVAAFAAVPVAEPEQFSPVAGTSEIQGEG